MPKQTSGKQGPICENMTFAGKEAYKRLRTNILFSFPAQEGCRVIGVTSAHMSDGKSTTAVNVAFTLAELEKKVLIIDADMRRPSQHEKLSLQQAPGLSNLLVGENNVNAVLQHYSSKVDGTGFDILSAGNLPPNPAELLSSERMENLLEALRTRYDYIVVDLPPVGAVTEAQTVARMSDGMLIVVREDNCPRPALQDCVDQLNFAGARILGFVFNGSHEHAKGYGKYGKYSQYGGGKTDQSYYYKSKEYK